MYRVLVRKKILKKIDKLKPYTNRIKEILYELRDNPFPKHHEIKKLKGRKDTFRIRVGEIRIIYKIVWNERIIYIEDIDFREGIY